MRRPGTRRLGRCAAASALALLAVSFAGPVIAPGIADAEADPPPPKVCLNPGQLGQVNAITRRVPWAQDTLAPERAWTETRGKGITVAVIDSGIDDDHPQLSAPGQVLPGFDFIRNRPGATFDCISHGTAVASIIAGRPVTGIGFHGVAPDARLLPVRVSDQEAGQDGDAVEPDVFARAIRYAADKGAQVINLSVVLYEDIPVIRAAIAYARRKDVVVVAAAGNQHRKQQQQTGQSGPDRTPYPAAYPGVIGVGATTIEGTRLDDSQVGSYVDLAAPGGGVLAATRVRGYLFLDGTSFATPYVSGTAALVRAAHPGLSADQVVHRLLATADTAPGGASGPEYGFGIVDPYRAVTESLNGANTAATPARVRTPTPDVAAKRRAAAETKHAEATNHSVAMLAVVAVAGGLLVGVIALGHRRRWTPSRVEAPDHNRW